MFRPSRTTWCWKPMSTWTPSNSIAADSPTLLLHVRGHGRRCVDGDGAALHLGAAARASTRPDGIAAIAHGQRDRCAGREAGATARADVDLEPGRRRRDRLSGT